MFFVLGYLSYRISFLEDGKSIFSLIRKVDFVLNIFIREKKSEFVKVSYFVFSIWFKMFVGFGGLELFYFVLNKVFAGIKVSS